MRIITWRFYFAQHFHTLPWLPARRVIVRGAIPAKVQKHRSKNKGTLVVEVSLYLVFNIEQTSKTPDCTSGMKLNGNIIPHLGAE
jgi:hypothetical protein